MGKKLKFKSLEYPSLFKMREHLGPSGVHTNYFYIMSWHVKQQSKLHDFIISTFGNTVQ